MWSSTWFRYESTVVRSRAPQEAGQSLVASATVMLWLSGVWTPEPTSTTALAT